MVRYIHNPKSDKWKPPHIASHCRVSCWRLVADGPCRRGRLFAKSPHISGEIQLFYVGPLDKAKLVEFTSITIGCTIVHYIYTHIHTIYIQYRTIVHGHYKPTNTTVGAPTLRASQSTLILRSCVGGTSDSTSVAASSAFKRRATPWRSCSMAQSKPCNTDFRWFHA